jgi:hypothetical protein
MYSGKAMEVLEGSCDGAAMEDLKGPVTEWLKEDLGRLWMRVNLKGTWMVNDRSRYCLLDGAKAASNSAGLRGRRPRRLSRRTVCL